MECYEFGMIAKVLEVHVDIHVFPGNTTGPLGYTANLMSAIRFIEAEYYFSGFSLDINGELAAGKSSPGNLSMRSQW